LSNVIKARSVVMPGGLPWADRAGVAPFGGTVPALARLLLDTAVLWHIARIQSGRLLEQAQRDAAAILERAESEADALRARAWEEGRQAGVAAGEAAGLEEGRKQLQGLLAAVERALAEAARISAEAAARHEEEIVHLALAIVGRVTRQPGVVGPETVRRLLEEMLPRTAGTQEITIRLNPADLESLRNVLPSLEGRLDGGARVRWVADDRVASGGCLAETDRGQLDARVETRLGRIAEHVLEVVRVDE